MIGKGSRRREREGEGLSLGDRTLRPENTPLIADDSMRSIRGILPHHGCSRFDGQRCRGEGVLLVFLYNSHYDCRRRHGGRGGGGLVGVAGVESLWARQLLHHHHKR